MGTEVIRYSLLGKEDLRFGQSTFEVLLADGRKVVLNDIDVGAILNDANVSTQALSLVSLVLSSKLHVTATDDSTTVLHSFGTNS